MDELNPFEDIAPYNDEEAAAALSKLAARSCGSSRTGSAPC